MDQSTDRTAPAWVARFLAALRDGHSISGAARAAGISKSTAQSRRKRYPEFAAAWAACNPPDGRHASRQPANRTHHADKFERFLDALAESSNVAAAALEAKITPSQVYKLRRTDPAFSAKWYAALAEGYDNLEMQLLQHLRQGEASEADEPAEGKTAKKAKPRFDVPNALRILAAHRDSVAREKGRRTLAEEAATIAAINARIDALRAKADANAGAIRQARKASAKRTDGDAQG